MRQPLRFLLRLGIPKGTNSSKVTLTPTYYSVRSASRVPYFWPCLRERKTKGQQLKGKIVSALLHIFWSRRYAERIWGDFFIWSGDFLENCRRISQRILMANFDREFFGLVFSSASGHPKNSRQKFTSRIVGIPLQFHFLEPKIYSRRFSAYGGDQHLPHFSTHFHTFPHFFRCCFAPPSG